MSESNNVKFVEANGKWLWKRYDEQGSVIFKSPEFDTERLAREDYDLNGSQEQASSAEETTAAPAPATAPTESVDAGNIAPEGEVSAGTASLDASESSADQTI
jgi:hypothetical protein